MARILVIDDEASIRDLITDILEEEGHEVLAAEDGRQGLSLFRQEPFELVITDMVMPEQSGINTIMELVRDYPEVKIIAISGGGAIEPERYLSIAKIIGAESILYKPFTADELLDVIGDILQ